MCVCNICYKINIIYVLAIWPASQLTIYYDYAFGLKVLFDFGQNVKYQLSVSKYTYINGFYNQILFTFNLNLIINDIHGKIKKILKNVKKNKVSKPKFHYRMVIKCYGNQHEHKRVSILYI